MLLLRFIILPFIFSGTLLSAAGHPLKDLPPAVQRRLDTYVTRCNELMRRSQQKIARVKQKGNTKEVNRLLQAELELELKGRITGPTFAEWIEMGNPLDLAKEHWKYIAGPSHASVSDPAYLENAQLTQSAFEAQINQQIQTGDIEFFDWQENLKQLHLIMTGSKNSNAFSNFQGSYQSNTADLVHPGVFRYELPKTANAIAHTEDLASAHHVESWLRAFGFPDKPVFQTKPVEVRFMNEVLAMAKRELVKPIYKGSFENGSQLYALPADIPLYQTAIWLAQHELCDKISEHRQAIYGNDTAKRIEAQDEVMDAISDFYHASIFTLSFNRVNNSIYMMQLNSLRQMIKLPPIQHGRLDMVAIRMNYLSFRTYLKWYANLYKIE